jgi:uncharacterized membrane protein YfcA
VNNLNKSAYILKILAIGMATGLCNGLFGAGGGMVAVPSMIHILKVDEHDAHATAIAIILPLLLISSFVYFRRGFLDLNKGIPVAAGGVIGGIAGAFLLHRIPERWLRKVFALFMIAAAVRMII